MWTLPVVALAIAFGGAVKTYAGTGESVRGWLWGGSENPSDGVINGNETSLGWVSMNNTDALGNIVNGAVSYGVNIPDSSCSGAGCKLSGYAWSENYGWIGFNEADVLDCFFGAPTRSGNVVMGAARILGIRDAGANAGGWKGCISLNSASSGSAVPYGVDITKMDGTGANPTYAWSDELGWIDFSRAQAVAPVPVNILKICPDTNPTILQGSSQTLGLYYDMRANCSDPGVANPVSAITWSESASFISLSSTGGTPTTIVSAIADGDTNNRTATITATYGADTVTATVTVAAAAPVCTCAAALSDAAAVCAGSTFTSTKPAGCDAASAPTCLGSKNCTSNKWKEIAPMN